MLLSVSELIGHLHPALVHLPIGILLIALLMQWLAGKEKYKTLKPAIPITLLWGEKILTIFFSTYIKKKKIKMVRT